MSRFFTAWTTDSSPAAFKAPGCEKTGLLPGKAIRVGIEVILAAAARACPAG
jgi:hypothetical protein